MDLLTNAIAFAPAHWNDGGSGGDWWWVWRIGMSVVWIALFAFLFFFVFRRAAWRHEPSGADRARTILAERYARGEISSDEYQERLDRLR